MTRTRAKQLERHLVAERARLQREVERLTTPPTDASGDHGRFGDDEIASTAGTSAEVDDALAARASRELDDVDRALLQLHEDPDHFGLCATCDRPIPIARLRLVPGTRYCRTHVPA
jgi:RNA polymerase-binding transcription factor DksA